MSLATFLLIIFINIFRIFDDEIYDLKVYLDVDFSFFYIDYIVMYILIFLQLVVFIGISKNLGYNVKKI